MSLLGICQFILAANTATGQSVRVKLVQTKKLIDFFRRILNILKKRCQQPFDQGISL